MQKTVETSDVRRITTCHLRLVFLNVTAAHCSFHIVGWSSIHRFLRLYTRHHAVGDSADDLHGLHSAARYRCLKNGHCIGMPGIVVDRHYPRTHTSANRPHNPYHLVTPVQPFVSDSLNNAVDDNITSS